MKIKLRKLKHKAPEQIDYKQMETAIRNAVLEATKENAKQYSLSREWMKLILFPVFRGMAILVGVLALGCFVLGGKIVLSACGVPINFLSIFTGMGVLFSGLLLSALSIVSWVCAKEIDEEMDRQYVAAMFSNMVAFVALILAVIALIRR